MVVSAGAAMKKIQCARMYKKVQPGGLLMAYLGRCIFGTVNKLTVVQPRTGSSCQTYGPCTLN